jgi:predicted ATPase
LGLEVDLLLLESVIKEFNLDLTSSEMKVVLNEAVSRNLLIMNATGIFFTFSHDRIREAAYELACSKESQESIHLKIGRCILCHYVQNETSDFMAQSLPAIDHLNRGRVLIHSVEEKLRLAQLNMEAAESLMKASAFKSAKEYLEIVIELLGDDPWKDNYSLTMDAHLSLSSSLFGNGSMDEALHCINEICRESRNQDDLMKSKILQLEVLSCNNKVEECINLSLQLLSELGLPKIPKIPGLRNILVCFFRVNRLLRNMKDDDILNLPECHDTRILNTLRICKF